LLIAQLDRTDLLGQPGRQLRLVAAAELAKPERRPDLDAVPLDRPSRPLVLPNSTESTFTCPATYTTAAGGSSSAARGNRASISKNFNISANPSRVDLSPTNRQSSSTSVQDPISSSVDHSRRMAWNPRPGSTFESVEPTYLSVRDSFRTPGPAKLVIKPMKII
jgi:hypothetical protein